MRNAFFVYCYLFLFTAEFIAHGSDVTCAALSPSSGRSLVTGGDDCRLNVWIVGQPQCVVRMCGWVYICKEPILDRTYSRKFKGVT